MDAPDGVHREAAASAVLADRLLALGDVDAGQRIPPMALAAATRIVTTERERRCASTTGPTASFGTNCVVIDIGRTQQELAATFGCSRESIARALTQLRVEGLLATGRRRITLLDLDGLRALAG